MIVGRNTTQQLFRPESIPKVKAFRFSSVSCNLFRHQP